MNNIKPALVFIFAVAILGGVSGCRGGRSESPPIHMNPNMDAQSKIKGQSNPAAIPVGTVPQNNGAVTWKGVVSDAYDPDSNPERFLGQDGNGVPIARIPLNVDDALVRRGQDRYNIYCAVCHDQSGSGKGMVVKRGFVPPPPLSDPRVVANRDGDLFEVISNGIRSMPSYAKQIPVDDRWAIVAYVRALQKMHHVRESELTPAQKAELDNAKETKQVVKR